MPPKPTSFFPLVLTLLLVIGCRAAEPVRIGDAYPRPENAPILLAIQPAVESMGVQIASGAMP